MQHEFRLEDQDAFYYITKFWNLAIFYGQETPAYNASSMNKFLFHGFPLQKNVGGLMLSAEKAQLRCLSSEARSHSHILGAV